MRQLFSLELPLFQKDVLTDLQGNYVHVFPPKASQAVAHTSVNKSRSGKQNQQTTKTQHIQKKSCATHPKNTIKIPSKWKTNPLSKKNIWTLDKKCLFGMKQNYSEWNEIIWNKTKQNNLSSSPLISSRPTSPHLISCHLISCHSISSFHTDFFWYRETFRQMMTYAFTQKSSYTHFSFFYTWEPCTRRNCYAQKTFKNKKLHTDFCTHRMATECTKCFPALLCTPNFQKKCY